MLLAIFRHRALNSALSIALALLIAMGPSAAIFGQGFGAQQAVRQRVQGLETSPEEAGTSGREGPPSELSQPTNSSGGGIDTRFIRPGAVVVLVLRPAQIMNAPAAELLPTEVATAAGQAYLGIDPANVEEVIFFGEPNMATPSYGVTLKFTQPFRASAIPPHLRPGVQLADLAGRKYWQSSLPTWPSFYGTDNQTLIAAPDPTLQPLVQSIAQASSGPLVDRLANVAAGNDLYLAVDVATLRPMIDTFAPSLQGQIPPDAQQYFQLSALIAAVELTVNLSDAGPSSLVIHGNDEAAAQQIETMISQAIDQQREKLRMQVAEQAASGDPVQQAMGQYMERLSGRWVELMRPVRTGATLTFFHPESQDPAKKQFMALAGVGIAAGLLMPAIQAARNAAQSAEAGGPGEGMEQAPQGFE